MLALTTLIGGRLASGSKDKTIRIWDPISEATLRVLSGHTDSVFALTALPDGRLASGSADKTIRIWNTISGVTLKVLSGHTEAVFALAVLPDGRLASGSNDQTIRIWPFVSPTLFGTLKEALLGNTSVVSLEYKGVDVYLSDEQKGWLEGVVECNVAVRASAD